MADAIDREFDWNEEIEQDGADFVALPPGEYPFTVTGFERGRYSGGDKLPPCNMAKLKIEIDGGEAGKSVATHRLYLHSKTEGLLCEFFRAIGARKHGERLRMDWGTVTGATGRCKTAIRKYNDEDYTDIKRFLDPADGRAAAKPAGFTPGAF